MLLLCFMISARVIVCNFALTIDVAEEWVAVRTDLNFLLLFIPDKKGPPQRIVLFPLFFYHNLPFFFSFYLYKMSCTYPHTYIQID